MAKTKLKSKPQPKGKAQAKVIVRPAPKAIAKPKSKSKPAPQSIAKSKAPVKPASASKPKSTPKVQHAKPGKPASASTVLPTIRDAVTHTIAEVAALNARLLVHEDAQAQDSRLSTAKPEIPFHTPPPASEIERSKVADLILPEDPALCFGQEELKLYCEYVKRLGLLKAAIGVLEKEADEMTANVKVLCNGLGVTRFESRELGIPPVTYSFSQRSDLNVQKLLERGVDPEVIQYATDVKTSARLNVDWKLWRRFDSPEMKQSLLEVALIVTGERTTAVEVEVERAVESTGAAG